MPEYGGISLSGPEITEIVGAIGTRTVVMVGVMGSGKGSVGRRVAARLGIPFVDSDSEVEKAAGMSIDDIVSRYGEPDYHAGEERIIRRLLESGPQVLSAGSGAFFDSGIRAQIRANGISIWLSADFEILVRRLSKRYKTLNHPLLKGHDPRATLLEVVGRSLTISSEADAMVDANADRHDIVVDRVIAALGDVVAHTVKAGKAQEELIKSAIEKTAESAPVFRPFRGRIRYRQAPAISKSISERKSVAQECCRELQAICNLRANEQPQLLDLANKYSLALSKLRKERGAFRLFIIGAQIETLLRIKMQGPLDPDRNPRLDGDLLFKAEALVLAHAALVTLFPDIRHLPEELDNFREQMEGVDAVRVRTLDPVLSHLARSRQIFDDETQDLTRELDDLSKNEAATRTSPSRISTSAKHAWLRGTLSAIAEQVIRTTKSAAGAIKKAIELARAISVFFHTAKEALLQLADAWPSTFGWLRLLIEYLTGGSNSGS